MILVSQAIALYIHVPFCRRRCNYCSFVSYDGREEEIPAYVAALKLELEQLSHAENVKSIYFGGGTPSLISTDRIKDILATVRSVFGVEKGAEITMEANPGTVDVAYLSAVRQCGVNRLSLGVQSLNNNELKMLGRIHSAAEAREAVRSARSAGFDNLSIDLMYGLPGQTLDGWSSTLEEAAAMRPEHISLYSLTLEAGTPLQRAIDEGSLPGIDPDLCAGQYEMAGDFLAAHGYLHYEISNWAQRGYECRHNLVYWQNLPYLGVGAAAHSFMHGHRLANTRDLDDYLSSFNSGGRAIIEMDEEISPALQLAETLILGLRLGRGVSCHDIKNRFGVDIMAQYKLQIEEMVEVGLLERNDGHIKLTPRGRLLSNEVFWRFLPE